MLKKFHLDIEPEVLEDIQKAINYYDNKRAGLGEQFYISIDGYFEFLQENYLAFAIKYDDVRCLPVKNFPYTIHYRVLSSQKIVSIKAVFSTYENPDKWDKRVE